MAGVVSRNGADSLQQPNLTPNQRDVPYPPTSDEFFGLAQWEWPAGFRHYVEDHRVRPSAAFEEFILATATKNEMPSK